MRVRADRARLVVGDSGPSDAREGPSMQDFYVLLFVLMAIAMFIVMVTVRKPR